MKTNNLPEGYFILSDEVRAAIDAARPVVALESTIIAHGMPYPDNVKTAAEVENIIRQNGVTPATIAILNGKICIGLNNSQLEMLGNTKDVLKVSLRDLAYVVSKKIHGATTVAATMRIASMAGIKIFVTGGIGGVHRNADKTMDISADLFEMSQCSVAVVSAGIKSILDIALTLEYLETHGVPVVTVGQDEFPAFYSRNSGLKSPMRIDDPASIAQLLKTKWELGLNGSVLVANPINEKDEIPFEEMEKNISVALSQAGRNKISGKEITPFLLKAIAKNSAGESLQANISLVKNNAMLGAEIAKSF